MAVEERSPSAEVNQAIGDIVERIADRMEDTSRRMVERYGDEIVDYRVIDDALLYSDVLDISRDNLRALIANVRRGELLAPEEVERTREAAARRVHQGVSLEGLLHAFRLWGWCVWEEIITAARTDQPAEREAALVLAGRIMRHIDLVSTAGAQGYLDEAQGIWSDREVVRRDLLDALLSGHADSEPARRHASSLQLHLRDDYVVLVVHRSDCDEGAAAPLAARAAMRRIIDTAKMHLRPRSGSLLVGTRQGEVVSLYPVEGAPDLERLRRHCAAFARAAANGCVSVGVGGLHPGLAGIAASYAEAREAAGIAREGELTGRAVHFEDVLLDYILRSNPLADRMLGKTIGPLREYDERRSAELIRTLRAYFDSGYNLTRAAAALSVHPNTVVYRLRRVRELSGRDPHDPNDLLLLSLGLRLADPHRP